MDLFKNGRGEARNPGMSPSPLCPSFIASTLQTQALPYTGLQPKKMQMGRKAAHGGPHAAGLVWKVLPTPTQKGPPCLTTGSDLAGKRRELFYGVDRNQLAVCPSFEGHHAIYSGEQSVVATPTNIASGMELRAPLPNNDSSGPDLFAAITFYAKTLGIAVSTVSTGAYALFMCHRCPQLCRPALSRRGSDEDFVNPNFSISLTVTLFPAVALPALPLENYDLSVPPVT